MAKCSICGKEIEGYGNNPYPICDLEDTISRCCDVCNSTYVIPARLLMFKKADKKPEVGDDIVIFWLNNDPLVIDYILRSGTIESIDGLGQLHGTWGGLAIIPDVDNFIIIPE